MLEVVHRNSVVNYRTLGYEEDDTNFFTVKGRHLEPERKISPEKDDLTNRTRQR